MATQIYTFRITYEGLEDKIWREVQVSSNYRLDQLGYLVLAAFDTLAYHLFAVEYKGGRFELPNEDMDPEEFLDMSAFKLSQMSIRIGEKLKMIYDFGTEQVFHIELLAVDPMPRGQGRRFPRIADGAGRGILDDLPAEVTAALIAEIDRNGHTDEPIFYGDRSIPWDYREFDMDIDNMLLKGEIEQIQEGYAPLWDNYDEE